uniref:Uncharacterized protein n=1 Tax=Anopheles atroparvus TaxID=41427 RepID=A0AAG5DP59_ANOAO
MLHALRTVKTNSVYSHLRAKPRTKAGAVRRVVRYFIDLCKFGVRLVNLLVVRLTNMETEVNVPKNEVPKPLSPRSENAIIERKAFQEELKRHRAKQLEFLEKQLTGFAGFVRERGTKNSIAQEKNQRANPKTPLKSIENLGEDLSDDVIIDQSPSFIKGMMRDYQVDGLRWMISLYHNGLNGILADEMGLGKTIQSISMIGYLMHVRTLKGPFLVIAPLSTIDNWMKEFAKFLPSAKTFKAHATGDGKPLVLGKLQSARRSWNVAVTSYEFLVQNRAYFSKLNFHYAVIDEGHRAKNENTLFSAALRRLNIQGSVMLTGTPIHNNLHELWALLNLLMPLFFNSADNFDSWFKVEDCLDPQNEQTRRLHNLLKPLMLRRIKSAVCPDIPPKIRITLFVPPTEEICLWSKKLLENDVQVMKSDGSYGKFHIAQRFPYLRQAACHPFLIPSAEPLEAGDQVTEQIVEYSSKMIVLDKLLKRLKERGSKVLIFSQFVTMLQILLDYLDYRGFEYCYISGSTSSEERKEQIDEFNRPGSDKFIFALSTRAGGLGINLVAADTVIFYDIDFNPQMDLQAEDRAHRIGQQKKVHIFRMIVRGTIEESLHSISQRKKQLDESVIQRKMLTRKLMEQADEFQQKNLFSVGTIDQSALDEKLDSVFHEMNTDEGLREECVIIVPGIPGQSMQNFDPSNVDRNLKRKSDVELDGSSKRRRNVPNFFTQN